MITRKVWNLRAASYRLSHSFWPLSLIKSREDLAARTLFKCIPQAPGAVLNLGCGTGSRLPAEVSRVAIGLDWSLNMLRLATSTISVCADVRMMPFSSYWFDLVVTIGVLEYVADPERVYAEASRVLKAQGYLLASISPHTGFTHLRRLLGARIYFHKDARQLAVAESYGFSCVAQEVLKTQHLFLFQKML